MKTYDRRSALWRIPADGGEEELVLDAEIHWACFAVSDQGIYFVRRKSMGKGPGENVEFFSFDTGKTDVIREDRRVTQAGIAVSPDGRWLLQTMVTYTGDLMLVENFHWPDDTR